MGKAYVLGAVRGLVSEGERAVAIIKRIGPEALAISVPKEGLAAMRSMGSPASGHGEPANPEEEAYMEWLSEFGEVVKPPPCFSMALKHADSAGIPVTALDMDDMHYTAAYCKYVTTLDMMRQGSSRKRMSKHLFSAETPEEFVLEWDGFVNRLRGYRELENAREEWLAKGIHRLAGKNRCALAIVELERLAAVERHLGTMGCDFETVH